MTFGMAAEQEWEQKDYPEDWYFHTSHASIVRWIFRTCKLDIALNTEMSSYWELPMGLKNDV